MIFVETLRAMLSSELSASIRREGNAYLCGESETNPRHAKHIIFYPMPENLIAHLIQSYKRNIPYDLVSLYREINGADMFWTTRYIEKAKISIPFCRFSIYGIPFSNSRENIQPFNISIEDLNRPNNTPDSWLKFGAYYEPNSFLYKRDLYVDTDLNTVYAVDHDCSDCYVIRKWLSIDDCLCDVFSLLTNS